MSGVPEVIHYQFQLEEDRTIDDDESSGSSTVSQIPAGDNDAGPGFHDEVISLLSDHGMDAVVPCFKKHNVSLYQFLTQTDKELQNLGVDLSSDREDILEVIKKFHQSQWRTVTSLFSKTPQKSLNVVERLDMMARITQHVYVETATLAYLRTRLNEMLAELDSSKDAIELLEDFEKNIDESCNAVIILKVHIQELLDEIRKKTKHEDLVPVDFVGPRLSSRWSTKVVVLVALSTAISALLWRSKLRTLFSMCIHSSTSLKR